MGKRVLIIEDEKDIARLLSYNLEKEGYEALAAADGESGLERARKEKPDLILLDLNFPADVGLHWDGFKVIAWLQRVDESKGLPVIVISGGDAAKFKARAIQAGAVAYLQKPVNNDELLALIKQSIATAARPETAQRA